MAQRIADAEWADLQAQMDEWRASLDAVEPPPPPPPWTLPVPSLPTGQHSLRCVNQGVYRGRATVLVT